MTNPSQLHVNIQKLMAHSVVLATYLGRYIRTTRCARDNDIAVQISRVAAQTLDHHRAISCMPRFLQPKKSTQHRVAG
jgi:hypothetical protein